MTIATNALIFFEGTQDALHTGTPGTVANGAFSAAGDTVDWTNDDDAPFGGAVFSGAFGVAPSVGSIGLYCQMLNIQSTNDEVANTAGYHFLGSFKIPYTASASAFYAAIPLIELPWLYTSQVLHFFIKNESTAQTISSGWSLWITPITYGPHA